MTNYQIARLAEHVVDDIDRLLKHFDIKRNNRYQKNLYLPCMIHGSDGHNSLNIYIGGYRVPFIWKCRTKHCECTFKKTIIGFTRALLSSENGWRSSDDTNLVVSFSDTISFLCQLYNIDQSNFHIDENEEFEYKDKNQFVSLATSVDLRKQANEQNFQGKAKKVSREKVRQFLKIPAEYYLKRGYSTEILDKYDIGLCDDPKSKDMYQRIVIPVYDETGQFLVGCTGRSIWEKCEKCKFCHNPESACPDGKSGYINNSRNSSKWRHNFESRFFLYNYWFALESLKKTSTALLVESPGNVLKLEMAGIHNSLAIFGNTVTKEQQFLLERAGVMDLNILLDNDEAGRLGRETIKKDYDKYYNLNFIDLPDGINDVGEMSVTDIKNLLGL